MYVGWERNKTRGKFLKVRDLDTCWKHRHHLLYTRKKDKLVLRKPHKFFFYDLGVVCQDWITVLVSHSNSPRIYLASWILLLRVYVTAIRVSKLLKVVSVLKLNFFLSCGKDFYSSIASNKWKESMNCLKC